MSNSLIITAGKEFAADCWVHTPLPANPTLNPNSTAYVSSLVNQIATYYGVASVNITQYTPPIYIVDKLQPTQSILAVRAGDASFNDWGMPPMQHELAAVAVPCNMQPAAGTDEEVVIYCPDTGQYWETWLTQQTGYNINVNGNVVPQWQAGWGGYMGPANLGGLDTLATNDGHFNYHQWSDGAGANMGVTATSIPFLAGMMTVAEQRKGVINHALGFACPLTAATFVYPAQRSDGSTDPANGGIPEGTMFTFPATLDLITIQMDPYALMIAKAVQKYGMVLWDTAGAVTFRAENPANNYPVDPYYGPYGILNPTSADHSANPPSSDYPDSNGRLKGFPWSQLIAINSPAK